MDDDGGVNGLLCSGEDGTEGSGGGGLPCEYRRGGIGSIVELRRTIGPFMVPLLVMSELTRWCMKVRLLDEVLLLFM